MSDKKKKFTVGAKFRTKKKTELADEVRVKEEKPFRELLAVSSEPSPDSPVTMMHAERKKRQKKVDESSGLVEARDEDAFDSGWDWQGGSAVELPRGGENVLLPDQAEVLQLPAGTRPTGGTLKKLTNGQLILECGGQTFLLLSLSRNDSRHVARETKDTLTLSPSEEMTRGLLAAVKLS